MEVLSAECSEPLQFLSELLAENLARHESLKRTVATNVVDLLETTIRAGWYFDDAFAYLVSQREFANWVKCRFKVSLCWIARLRRLGRHFARDLVDTQQRQRLGIHPPALKDVPCGIHLRNQLASVGAGSINELLRVCGILPANHHESSRELGNGQAPSSSSSQAELVAIKRLRVSLQKSTQLCERLNLRSLDLSMKSSLELELRGIVRFYSELRSEF